MTEEQQSGKGHWLGQVLEGGLPQVIAGPAGKAISRLIAGAADIPAAWLEHKAQAIRDETKARSGLMEQLSAKSAELGLKDELLLSRGLDSLLGRAYREQQNREQVAKKTIEQLQLEPPSITGDGPSDDWMNVFEQHAARASSERLQTLFAQILAGEVRRPGAFSLSTLHMVSVLDQHTAGLITKLVPFVLEGHVILSDALEPHVTLDELIDLEDSGLITGSAGTLSINPNSGESGRVRWGAGGRLFVVEFEPNQTLTMGACFITRPGRELIKLVTAPTNFSAIATAFWKAGAKSVKHQMLDPQTGTPVGWIDLAKPE